MTTGSPITLAGMQADLAGMLDVPADEIDVQANLTDIGLDSMRTMTLIGQWADAGVPIDFGDLIGAEPTLSGWWQVIARLQPQA